MVLSLIIYWFNVFILGYFIMLDGFYSFLMGISIFSTLRHLKRLRLGRADEMFKDSIIPPVSILVPAFNEENVIVQNILGLMSLNYPQYEVIIINDNSTDHTLSKIIKAFDLKPIDLIYRPIIATHSVKCFYLNPKFPKLILVDKAKGGKADSLNVGINLARSPYFCSIDADTLLEKDALLRLVKPIIEHPTTTIASGGIVRIVNGCEVNQGAVTRVLLSKNILSKLQVVEYLRSFLFGRTGMSFLSSLMIISGTFSLFHKKSVQDVGGYNPQTVSEDMEIIVRLHRYFKEMGMPYRIVFVSDPVCWTEAPSTLSMLAKQRRRWHKGLAESLGLHFKMMLNPKYGAIGFIGMPYQFIFELVGPFIEFTGYLFVGISYAAGLLSVTSLFVFFNLAIVYGIFLSIGALFLEEITYRRYPRWRDFMVLFGVAVLENLGYRQLNMFWRVQALIQYAFGIKKWEVVRKKGFVPSGQKN